MSTKLDENSINGWSSDEIKDTTNGFGKSTTVSTTTLKNGHLNNLDVDVLYHFSMDTKSHDFKKIFGDVKFVCCGGSANRIRKFAANLKKFLRAGNFDVDSSSYLDKNDEPRNFCENSDRYVIYKIGPVLCANHGIGIPSTTIMLHEMFKLLHYAGCKDVTFVRLGTSGGIGVEPGTVVISNGALNGGLEECFEAFACGKRVKHEVHFDQKLIERISSIAQRSSIPFAVGKTLSCDDFYEAQGRLDGAFCMFDQQEKLEFMKKIHALGVRNIEMEATAFSAMTARAGHKCAVVCVTLVNRLLNDQVTSSHETLKSWEERPCKIVASLIKESLSAGATL